MSRPEELTQTIVEPHNNGVPAADDDTLLERLHRALGPLAGGLILDFADLLTFGPLGLIAGPIVGVLVGWWVSSIYGFAYKSRAVWAVLGGLYCAIPFTEVFPLATFISAIARFRKQA